MAPSRLTRATAVPVVIGAGVVVALVAAVATAATWDDSRPAEQGKPIAASARTPTAVPAPTPGERASPDGAQSPSAPQASSSPDAGLRPSPASPSTESPSPSSPSNGSSAPSPSPRQAGSVGTGVVPSPARGPSPTPAPSSSPTRASAIPGTYTFDVTGSLGSSIGMVGANGTQSLVVDPPGPDGFQHSRESGGQTTTDETLRYDPDGVHLRALRVTFPTVDETFTFDPAVLLVPLPATSGRRSAWHGIGADGSTVDFAGTVDHRGTDTVGGMQVGVAVIVSTIHVKGARFDLTIDETDHYDDADHLVVETDQSGHGTISGISITSTTVAKLRSLHPG